MSLRPKPSFLVAVAALLIAFSGGAVAGGKIGSAQIKNNSVTTKDIKNGTIRGMDIKKGSIPPSKLRVPRCSQGQVPAFGVCAQQVVVAKWTFAMAQDVCSTYAGRLPSFSDLSYLYGQSGFQWANGDDSQYEWVSDSLDDGSGPRPSARDAAGNLITDTGSQPFYFHCLVSEY